MAPAKKTSAKKATTAANKKRAVKKTAPAKVVKKAAPAPAAKKKLAGPTQADLIALLQEIQTRVSSVLTSMGVEPEVAEDDPKATFAATLESKTDRQLKALAKKKEYWPDEDVDEADREKLIENLVSYEFDELDTDDEDEEADEDGLDPDEAEEDEDDAEEADDEDDDDEEEDEEEDEGEEDDTYTREDLLKMNLRAIKALAVEQEKAEDASELKGMDKDSIIDLIMGDDEESEDDEEEDEEEGDYYSREDYEAMSVPELKKIADENGVKYPKTVKPAALIELLLEA